MKIKLDTRGQVYTMQRAQAVASQLLEADSDGWDYVVESQGSEAGMVFARVAVYDETGKFVGYF